MTDKVHQEWKQFGREVRRNRARTGLSQAEVGKSLQLTGGMIGHIERATRVPSRDHAEKLDTIFATEGEMLKQWLEVIEGRHVLPWFKDALEMERRARAICEYHSILIPGLLQTTDYSRVLIRARLVGASEDEIKELVRVRSERLPKIQPNRPNLWFVVDEIVITRIVGDEKTMVSQLGHIVALAEEGTIRFQVVPGDVRAHCGLCSPFRLMTMRDSRKVVRMEHTLGGATFEKLDAVDEMSALFGALQAEALSPTRSISFIRSVMKGMQ
ncbi:helix-turn-helix domain-containing protein [Nocardiopsis sp. LOL_012]|uniref:helix-turn-helix domain-containing protein n=1 Tax=Nocardiopsis sp. LOL_012 TaxID=3345409 RepID=UPI003A8519EE